MRSFLGKESREAAKGRASRSAPSTMRPFFGFYGASGAMLPSTTRPPNTTPSLSERIRILCSQVLSAEDIEALNAVDPTALLG